MNGKIFLALEDVIVNMDDVVMIVPRFKVMPVNTDEGRALRATTKKPSGVTIYIRGKEYPVESNVLYDEVVEQLKLAVTGTQ